MATKVVLSLFCWALFPQLSYGNGKLGRPARDFTLQSARGDSVHLAQYKGKVVLLNFWASWCGPCRQELPELAKLQQAYRDSGLVVLAVNVDRQRTAGERYLKQVALKELQVLWDNGAQVVEVYQPRAMPASFLIDRQGVIRYDHLGYRKDILPVYRRQIEALLAPRAKE